MTFLLLENSQLNFIWNFKEMVLFPLERTVENPEVMKCLFLKKSLNESVVKVI